MLDRSSRPHRSPQGLPTRAGPAVRTAAPPALAPLAHRPRDRPQSGDRSAPHGPHRPEPGSHRLKPPQAVRRYERASPVELLHIDTKRLGRIPRRGPPHHRRPNPEPQPWHRLGCGASGHRRPLPRVPSPRSWPTRQR
nr:hypothetical protein [Paracidovorax citrulli]